MIRIAKKINSLFEKEQKWKIIVLIFLMIIGAFLEVLGVGLMIPFMTALMDKDALDSNGIVRKVCDLFGFHSQSQFILLCVIVLIVVFVIKDFYLIFQEKLQLRFVYNSRFKTQCMVLNAYLEKPYEFYLNTNTGEVVRAVCDDVNYAYLILTTFLSMLTNLVMGIALVSTIMIISPIITLSVMGSTVVAVLAIIFFVKPVLKREGENRTIASAKASMWLFQSVQGIKEIKVTQSSDYFRKSYNESGLALIRADQKNNVWGTISKRIIEMCTVSMVLLVIAAMILEGADLQNLIPALSAFAMAAVRLLPAATAIVNSANVIAYQEKALDRLLHDLEELDRSIDKKENISKDSVQFVFKDSIELKDIVYSYPGSEKKVLDGANMVIPIGKSVGIVGESGAGKTTVVDVLLGLLEPESGVILTDGIDIKSHYAEWLKHVGYIPQMIFLIDDTIKKNVMFGKDYGDKTDEYVIEALKEAQLYDYVCSLPEGINTRIGERGVKLSGGQRQRIGIARALFGRPEILVFDEATSALDTETEDAIMTSINMLKEEKTMIFIAHRLSTLKDCDLLYRVVEGKIVKTNRKELGI